MLRETRENVMRSLGSFERIDIQHITTKCVITLREKEYVNSSFAARYINFHTILLPADISVCSSSSNAVQ